MSTEPGTALARNTDPETSHESADAVQGAKASRIEQMVLDALLAARGRGMTPHELVAYIGLPWSTVTPRLRPLANRGLVVDSGGRRFGPTDRACIVWRLP